MGHFQRLLRNKGIPYIDYDNQSPDNNIKAHSMEAKGYQSDDDTTIISRLIKVKPIFPNFMWDSSNVSIEN